MPLVNGHQWSVATYSPYFKTSKNTGIIFFQNYEIWMKIKKDIAKLKGRLFETALSREYERSCKLQGSAVTHTMLGGLSI